MGYESTLSKAINTVQEGLYSDYAGRKITAKDACILFRPYAFSRQEHLQVITLDAKGALIGLYEITKGILDSTHMHPREIFFPALRDFASAIYIAHNHPSGNFLPSPEDKDCTTTLIKAGAVLGIRVLDHLVITRKECFCISKNKLLKEV